MNKRYLYKPIKALGFFGMLLALVIVSGCSDDIVNVPGINDIDNGNTVSVGIMIPDMKVNNTRAFGDKPESGMKLTVIEFDRGTDATNSFLSRVYPTEIVSPTTAVENDGVVQFKFDIIKTTKPKILHFVVTPSNVTVDPRFGSEAEIFSTLSVSDRTQAYWGRVEFPTGYAEESDEVNEDGIKELVITRDAKDKLTNVPVIRNFAKVSFDQENMPANFQLHGFQLINVPNSGTIAPYNVDKKEFPTFLNDSGSMLPFSDIVKNYTGILPSGVSFINTEEDADGWTVESTGTNGQHQMDAYDKFFYEHPYEGSRRTYVIIRGAYLNNEGTWEEPRFYKIDLGTKNATTSLFEYYDGLLRNIDYHITIKAVYSNGYRTPSEAITGVTSNNLSADVDARGMLSVFDGQNMISVNRTTIVFTNDKPVEFLYQYTTNYSGSKNDLGNGNSAPNFKTIGLVADSEGVIKSVTTPESFTDDEGKKWVKVIITPNAVVPKEQRKQVFYVVDGNGLGREITLLLNEPYEYSNLVVYPGSLNEYTSTTTGKNTVSPNAGEAFTVYFNLQKGIPEEVFPLEFVLESDRQNLENNPIGTLVVTSGETLFPTPGISYDVPRIKYIKTVSLQEYKYKYFTDTNNVDINTENPDHLVRCRFRTINSLVDLPGSPTSTTTHVVIDNPYFNVKNGSTDVETWPGVVTFTRTR